MDHEVSCTEVLQSLYKTFLNRLPQDDEIALWVREAASGSVGIENMVRGVCLSDEALEKSNSVSRRGLAVGLNTQHAGSWAPAVDDLLETIAICHEELRGASPSFSDVLQCYRKLRAQDSLASYFRDELSYAKSKFVASPVGSSSVEDLPRFLSIVYKIILRRPIGQDEIEIWRNNIDNGLSLTDLIWLLAESDEARDSTYGHLMNYSPRKFVQLAIEIIARRGASLLEIRDYESRITDGLSRERFLGELFSSVAYEIVNDVKLFHDVPKDVIKIFGVPDPVVVADWVNDINPKVSDADIDYGRFPYVSKNLVSISILTSLYNGRKYIEAFMENMIEQTVFGDCELIVVDACSPQDEAGVIAKYAKKFKNIVYKRTDTRIGIYEAWNIAAQEAKGEFLTNANVDDCRRCDSFELQASCLQVLPFVDVVFQDVYYSFLPNLKFGDIERRGCRTHFPNVSRYNLMQFNLPHNGPMWRKALHDELGYFDAQFKSAGDSEFWFRCLIANKVFYKLNAAHVGYYMNPEGLSTSSETVGIYESRKISEKYYSKMLSPLWLCSEQEFSSAVAAIADPRRQSADQSVADRYALLQNAMGSLAERSRV